MDFAVFRWTQARLTRRACVERNEAHAVVFRQLRGVLVVQRKIIARGICQRLLVENLEMVGINDP